MAQKLILYKDVQFPLHYEFLNLNISHPQGVICFLHGWGSNKELMKLSFGQSFRDFIHLYVDMPGFGGSACDRSLNTNDYAEILRLFFGALKNTNKILDSIEWIMLGHSFGGKVATLLADKRLILLSSAGILEKKSLRVRCKIALAKVFKKLGLSANILRSKDASGLNNGMYETFKNVVNEDFRKHFAACNAQAFIFWGEQDGATTLQSGKEIAALMKRSYFFVMQGDHYFFMKQAKIIEEEFMKNIQTKCFLVFGKVQGVGYRKYAKYKADELGIFGSAQNLDDGSVEIYAQAEQDALTKYKMFLEIGPHKARVENVKEKNLQDGMRIFQDFVIIK